MTRKSQVIEKQLFDPQVYEYLKELTGNNAVFHKHNVRNTPKIVNFISRVANSSMVKQGKGFGPNVECLPSKITAFFAK